jgi:hypothetical protein
VAAGVGVGVATGAFSSAHTARSTRRKNSQSRARKAIFRMLSSDSGNRPTYAYDASNRMVVVPMVI